jgi:hypothetical protein
MLENKILEEDGENCMMSFIIGILHPILLQQLNQGM